MTRAGNRHVYRCLVDEVAGPGSLVPISQEDARHLVRVVRRSDGDAIELIDADGMRWPAVIVREGAVVCARVTGPGTAAAAPLPIDVWLGAADWPRIEIAVQMATELGLSGLTLFASARAAPVRDWERRRARLDRVAIAAARQSGRGRPPAVGGLVPFADMVTSLVGAAGPVVVLDPRAEQTITDTLRGHTRATLVVGGEAGLSDGELETLTAAGAVASLLGPGILRAETAAVTAIVAAATAMGAL